MGNWVHSFESVSPNTTEFLQKKIDAGVNLLMGLFISSSVNKSVYSILYVYLLLYMMATDSLQLNPSKRKQHLGLLISLRRLACIYDIKLCSGTAALYFISVLTLSSDPFC
jgi:hypothetical protein